MELAYSCLADEHSPCTGKALGVQHSTRCCCQHGWLREIKASRYPSSRCLQPRIGSHRRACRGSPCGLRKSNWGRRSSRDVKLAPARAGAPQSLLPHGASSGVYREKSRKPSPEASPCARGARLKRLPRARQAHAPHLERPALRGEDLLRLVGARTRHAAECRHHVLALAGRGHVLHGARESGRADPSL